MFVNILPVTVVVPVKNEEKNLAKCLSCLTGFAQVVVVDSESTDATTKIARQMGVQVVSFRWNGQFPKKRNWYLRNYLVKTPWVLFIDADEYISDVFKVELAQAITDTPYVGFWLRYQNHFLGKPLNHNDDFRKLALFRPEAGEYEYINDQSWSGLDMEVHEHPILKGPTGTIKTLIRHEDFKGMRAYIDRHNHYSSWEARRYMSFLTENAKEWSTFIFRQKIKYYLMDTWFLGPLFFIYSFFFKLGFLDGKRGFIFSLCKAMYFLQIKIKIEELRDISDLNDAK
jgi:glycosyltransferase involved in cell wall biosynthesis